MNKEKIIKIRLTESERKMIEELARVKGRTISQQIREMIYKEHESYHLFDPVPPEDIDKP